MNKELIINAAPQGVEIALLEDKKLVTSWLSDPTPERGGRSRRHYRLEAAGEAALRESAVTARRLLTTVERIWGTSAWSAPSHEYSPARVD